MNERDPSNGFHQKPGMGERRKQERAATVYLLLPDGGKTCAISSARSTRAWFVCLYSLGSVMLVSSITITCVDR